MPGPKLHILLCAPRGFCAGVERAIQVVEEALERFGAPVYVRHEIVHNRYVVESLKAKGAVFVEELEEIPESGPAGRLLRARRVEEGARGRREPQHLRARRHLPARLQGPQGSDPALPPRPRDRARRPCRPSRGGGHDGPASRRHHHARRDGRRMRARFSRASPTISPGSRRRRSPSTTRRRSWRS